MSLPASNREGTASSFKPASPVLKPRRQRKYSYKGLVKSIQELKAEGLDISISQQRSSPFHQPACQPPPSLPKGAAHPTPGSSLVPLSSRHMSLPEDMSHQLAGDVTDILQALGIPALPTDPVGANPTQATVPARLPAYQEHSAIHKLASKAAPKAGSDAAAGPTAPASDRAEVKFLLAAHVQQQQLNEALMKELEQLKQKLAIKEAEIAVLHEVCKLVLAGPNGACSEDDTSSKVAKLR